MIFLGITLMLLLFGGMGGTMYWVLKKTDPNKSDTSVKDDIQTAQEFLPFDTVQNHVVHLGGFQYRAYIEVDGLNYFLKTEDEQDLVELSYQRLINSLSHPISLFIQTRVFNSSELLNEIADDYEKTLETFPSLINFAEESFRELEELYANRGVSRVKKKYIIVPFDESSVLTEADDETKHEYALEEIFNRCRIITDLLANMGIKSRILTSAEIVELIAATYHRDNYRHYKPLIEGEFGTLVVSTVSPFDKLTDPARLDWILYETQMKLQQELFHQTPDEDIKKRTQQALKDLEATREALAGWHKQYRGKND